MKKDKSEQWWRWLLFIPAGLLTFSAGIIIFTLINLIEYRFGGQYITITLDISQIFVGVISLYFSVVVSAAVAPKEKTGAIIYSCLMLLFYGAVLFISLIGAFIIPNVRTDWLGYVAVIAYIITLVVSIIKAANDDFKYI